MSHRLNIVRLIVVVFLAGVVWVGSWLIPETISRIDTFDNSHVDTDAVEQEDVIPESSDITNLLNDIEVKGKAPKTGYSRSAFGDGWSTQMGCDVRNQILRRDLLSVVVDENCKVQTGTLIDPYTAQKVSFVRGTQTSSNVQIDHVVSLSNAWQTGIQYNNLNTREMFANDPLNLLAVGGGINSKKSDSDAASWLPPNKSFRCDFVTKQITVKHKYKLWVTLAEKLAMESVLSTCPLGVSP